MNGYDLLSGLIVAQPELLIVRRFLHVQIRSILFQQAELIHLEQSLFHTIKADNASHNGNARPHFQSNILKLLESADDAKQNDQLKKDDRDQAKLKEYRGRGYTSLSKIRSLTRVNQSDLYNLNKWMTDKDGGKHFQRGDEAFLWTNASNREDLTSVTGRDIEQDILSNFIEARIIPWYDKTIGHRYRDRVKVYDPFTKEYITTPLNTYSDHSISSAINTLTTVLSSLWPAIPIFALTFVQKPLLRMSLMVTFAFLFNATIMLLTKARRVDNFTAAAAFGAIQVVFIGGGGGNNNGTMMQTH